MDEYQISIVIEPWEGQLREVGNVRTYAEAVETARILRDILLSKIDFYSMKSELELLRTERITVEKMDTDIKETIESLESSLAALRKELDDYKKALEVIESECDCDCVVEENHFCIKHEAKNALDVYRTPSQEERGT